MKTPPNKPQSKALVWALVCASGFLFANRVEPATLRLQVQLPASHLLFFPVVAELALENTGSQALIIEDFPRPHLVRVDITKLPTGAIEYQGYTDPLTGPDERYVPPITLEPGDTSKFSTIVAAKWGPEKEPLAPAFTSTGLFSLRFTYPVKFRENGNPQVEYVRSSPVTVQVTNVPARHRAALEDVRKMRHLVWMMQPKAAAFAEPIELASFEEHLRQHVDKHPDSPWASLAKFALASRLYEKFIRAGQPQALRQEITNLLNDAQAEGEFYRHDAGQLQKRMERVLEEERSHAKSKAAPPAVAQAVEAQFKKLVDYMARGETNAISPLLLPEFRYNAQLNTSDWLAKLKREHEATAPFPMAIRFKTVSITGPEDETVLTAEVTFESGVRKSVRHVAATYQLIDKTWLLTSWRNVGVAEP